MCLWIFILLLAALEVEFVLKIVAAFSVLQFVIVIVIALIR